MSEKLRIIANAKVDAIKDEYGTEITVDRTFASDGESLRVNLDIQDAYGEGCDIDLTFKQAKQLAKQIYAITNPGGMII